MTETTGGETAATAEEILWVAREARALVGSDDEQRRSAFLARKRALLAHLTEEAR